VSSRATGRPRRQPPSGSIRHDREKPHPLLQRKSISLVQVRPRSRSSQPPSGQARKAQIGVKLPLPSVPSRVAGTAPPHDHSARHLSTDRLSKHRAEIPIARTAERHHHPRVPSLKAFGRRPRRLPHHLGEPSSETLNTSGQPQDDAARPFNAESCHARESERGRCAIAAVPALAGPQQCYRLRPIRYGRAHSPSP
jgi:hypothetical protein